MTDPLRRKKTLGRGMSDLVGDTLESLVRGVPAKEPPRPGAGGEPRAAEPPPSPVPGPIEPAPDPAPDVPGPDPFLSAPAPDAGTPPERPAGLRESTRPDDRVAAVSAFPAFPKSAEVAERVSRGSAKLIAVASGKGGTGKSLLAVNLAIALAETRRVALVDADLGLANAHILLGLLPRWDVSHLLAGERSLDEIVLDGPRGLKVLPGASGVPEMASLDDASLARLAAAIEPLLGRSQAAILDCPGGLSRQSLLFLHGADVVLVVTTGELPSMTDSYALIKTITTHRPRSVVGLVVNDARSAADGAETYRKISHVARKFLGRDILSLGTIPRDPYLEQSVMERRPVLLGYPASASARALRELARRVASLEGLEPALGFPERLRRTLAAAAAASDRASKIGERPCA